MWTSLLPLLIALHVALALALFLPSILLPFALRVRYAPRRTAKPGPAVRALLVLQTRATAILGAAVVVTGLALLAVLGWGLLAQPWLLVALSIYAASLVLAFFVQRPSLRRLVGIAPSGDDATWAVRARRQRYVSYLMAALI